jgi:hypothetical protein
MSGREKAVMLLPRASMVHQRVEREVIFYSCLASLSAWLCHSSYTFTHLSEKLSVCDSTEAAILRAGALKVG